MKTTLCVLASLLGGILGGCLMSKTVSQCDAEPLSFGKVTATEYVLQTRDGKMRGHWLCDSNGNPELYLISRTGLVIHIQAVNDSVSIALLNEQQHVVSLSSYTIDKGAFMSVFDGTMDNIVSMSTISGEPCLSVLKDGKFTWTNR